jgi:hypothetical protein
MKPNTVVLGYFNKDESGTVRHTTIDQKLPQDVQAQIKKFPNDADDLADVDYVSILKDINAAGKNLLIARK